MGVTGIGIGIGIGPFDLGGASAFSPLSLFAGSEEGAWYDPSDLSTLWQDSAGTTPVTGDGDPVGRIDDKSGNGNHATQSTAGARPVYKTSGGLHWIEGDGVDDALYSQGGTLMTGIDSASVAAAVEHLGDGTGTLGNQVVGFGSGSAARGGWFYQGDWRWTVVDIGNMTTRNILSGVTTAKAVMVSTHGLDAYAEINGSEFSLGFTPEAYVRDILSAFNFSVGSTFGAFPHRRNFGMVVIDRPFTASERAALRTYLAEKSGVTL